MAHRHFGLGHLSLRSSSRRLTPGFLRQLAALRRSLSFRAGYAAERAFQRLKDRLAKAERSSRQQIAVDVIYMGRVIFHVGETRTYAYLPSAQSEGSQ